MYPTKPNSDKHVLDANPIPAAGLGAANLLKHNTRSFLAAVCMQLLAPAMGVVWLLVWSTKFDTAKQIIEATRQDFYWLAVGFVIMVLVGMVASLALDRILLVGSRDKRITLSEAMSFGLSRLPAVIVIVGLFYIALGLPVVGIIWLAIHGSLWSLLWFIPLLLVYAIVTFLAAPAQFILVDDGSIANPITILKKLSGLWKYGFWTLATYALLTSFVAGGAGSGLGNIPNIPNLSSTRSNNTQKTEESTTPQYDSNYYTNPTQQTDMTDSQQESTDTNSGPVYVPPVPGDAESPKSFADELSGVNLNIWRWGIGIVSAIFLLPIAIAVAHGSILAAGFALTYDKVKKFVPKY